MMESQWRNNIAKQSYNRYHNNTDNVEQMHARQR